MGFEETSSKMMSDQDTDSSNPSSQSYLESPYSSPSQQVPQLTNYLTVLRCTDGNFMQTGIVNGPFLSITEQPSNHFRFRYKSEMVGTHGCLTGKSSASNRIKTYPSVGLMNYNGAAIIKCRLAQYNNEDDHPHQLVEDEQEKDLSAEVNAQKGYEVRFQGLGIIHISKKEVPALLYKKYSEANQNINLKDLKIYCDNTAKKINLNIVRLKFSAFDVHTKNEICPPVFSEPIHNMKSAATNDLKICRMSLISGRPQGGDDIFMLTEKVNKKDIQIRFVEIERGEVVWTGNAHFLMNDVHHQYAIVCSTPKYKKPDITTDVKVYVELYRPSDKRTSQRMEFTYKAEEVFRQKNSSYSSIGSGNNSIKSFSDIPETAKMINDNHIENAVNNFTVPSPQNLHHGALAHNGLSEALYSNMVMATDQTDLKMPVSPMLGQPNVPEPPIIDFGSGDIDAYLRGTESQEDMKMYMDTDMNDYFHSSFGKILFESEHNGFDSMKSDSARNLGSFENMSFISSSMQLTPDSGRRTGVPSTSKSQQRTETQTNTETRNGYTAFYTQKDGVEVKKLVKELCEIIRNKTQFKKQDIRTKLNRLFDLRLSNGDTFLHMTLSNNILPSMEYIVKLIHTVNMKHLLNEKNSQGQTLLHLAVIHDLPDHIPFLVSKGCDPMMSDREGNNVVHYAVKCQSCLATLLTAMKTHNLNYDLNAYNAEKKTALHLDAVYGTGSSAKLLLSESASYSVRDANGRTPLHIAANNSNVGVMRVLLEFIPVSDIDVTDCHGVTALQIAGGAAAARSSTDSVIIFKMLLEKGADPKKSCENSEPAIKTARKDPALKDVIMQYEPAYLLDDDDIKSEPEDDFELADDGYSQGFEALPVYIDELAGILDRSDAWRELAQRLEYPSSLLTAVETSDSPTTTLLTNVKDYQEDVTSLSLAKILLDMGQHDAAHLILRYIELS